MLRTIEKSGPQLSSRDIQALEVMLGQALPDDYAAFLLRSNGGRPAPDEFPVQGWLAGGPTSDVHTFMRLQEHPIGADDILWTLDVMKGRLPAHLLPIADTSFGDLICIWLTGQQRGTVVLWDHEDEHRPPTTRNIYQIAQSFGAFLELLGQYPDD